MTALTRYRKLVPLPAEQVCCAFVSGENATKKISSLNVRDSARIFWFGGSVNFQPRSFEVITVRVCPLTSTRSLSLMIGYVLYAPCGSGLKTSPSRIEKKERLRLW